MASTHDYINDKRNEDIYIYINGEFFHRSEAKISVFDSGFLLGDGVWEGIRLHKGHLCFQKEHINRLFEGAKALQIKIGKSRSELVNIIYETLNANGRIIKNQGKISDVIILDNNRWKILSRVEISQMGNK